MLNSAFDLWANDRIYIDGRAYQMKTAPLKQYFAKAGITDPFNYWQQGAAAHYVDEYEVRNNLLYLRKIDGVGGVARFFPECPQGLIAYWFDGILEIYPDAGSESPNWRLPVRGGVMTEPDQTFRAS